MVDAQTIHANEFAIHKALGQDYRYRIPSYQRPYAWDTKHVMALLDDLDDARAELPDYFLGAIVLVKSPDGFHDVIDGQQRLTTLTILYAVLAELLPEREAKEIRPFLMQEANKFQGQPEAFRLTVREQERSFFETYVQKPGGLSKLLAMDRAKLAEVEQRIHRNVAALHDALSDRSTDELLELATYLSMHAFLVIVRAEQFETAYRIFTVMNDRGLELAASDILKAEVIGQLDESVRGKYAQLWEDTEESLGRDAFSDLFSHIRMIELHKKATSSILRELQQQVLPQYDARVFVDEVVVPYGEDLRTILRSEWKAGPEHKAINRRLRWLNEIDNFDWIPPTLYVMRRFENEPHRVLSFLELLDRLASSMHLRRVYVQPRIKRYGQVLDLLGDPEADWTAPGSPLLLTEEEKRRTREVIGGDIYGLSGGVAKYLLMRLDAEITDSAATWDHEIISIEHVLPQGPPADSEWTDWFNETEQLEWTHKLANLVPLNRRRNSAAQNFSFDKKKTQYFSVDGEASPFTLTNQVLHKQSWTPEVLTERQTKLVGKLVGLWGLGAEALVEPNSTSIS